jgi:L-aminopeptidase/D-esterase-like protein
MRARVVVLARRVDGRDAHEIHGQLHELVPGAIDFRSDAIDGVHGSAYNNPMRTMLTMAAVIALQSGTPAVVNTTLTAVPGIKVGHHTLAERPTGCTVILVDGDAVGGVSQRGGAPGTRETDLLNPLNMVDKVNAVVLAGGSAFGLDAATGTVRWLEEHNIGWPAGVSRVPIVPAAILFDLGVGGNPKIRPTADCGYKAAEAATTAAVQEGTIGAGAGATVGKFGGAGRATKSGIGTASIALPNGLIVAAIVAVNAVGDIIDPASGKVVAGVRNPDGTFADARKILRSGANTPPPRAGENTTIGVVATNAKLSKALAARMALMADDGYARAISPSHTNGDGDTIFSLATGRWDGAADITIIGALAAEAMADAVVRAGTQATAVAGIPAARDLRK